MRRRVVLFLLLALSQGVIARAEGLDDLKGQDWIQMSLGQKQDFVYRGIGALERQGVSLLKSPSYYIEALDKVLKIDEGLREEYLDNLFVFCVHESEPHTRQALEKIRNSN
ncbi:MAG TPA: hypothetical protein VD883_00605 [Candidatus Omnitrophota bacterium]|nr:hypothetical protein [Candidatus Omnitrophota bacterium]